MSKVTQSCPTLCDPMDYSPWNSPGKNTGVGSLSLLQGIVPTQGLNPGLLHCFPHQLSHKGSCPSAVPGCNLKNDRIISVHFQGKPFNITVIQVYAPITNVEEAEVECFYEDLQDLLELTPQKRCPIHYRGLECKSRKSRNTWGNRQIWPWNTE